ncbi:MAG: hypothetical protein IJA25_05875 [Anaerotignum sp.]|nr:hypothetical protein [Anaerotignum sp.]MBQ7103598.1 hypothetical protein [Anaerotignum sp.]
MDDQKTPKISIGITSMTVILCVLCLTVFSVLSLSTALSERKLAEKRAVVAQEYYRAEKEAASLVNRLQDKAEKGEDISSFASANGIVVKNDLFFFHKTIDDGQDLSVILQYKDGFDILEWKVVSTADWTPDESLHVWDGEMLFEE